MCLVPRDSNPCQNNKVLLGCFTSFSWGPINNNKRGGGKWGAVYNSWWTGSAYPHILNSWSQESSAEENVHVEAAF